MLYWVLKHILLGPLMKLFCRPKIEGVEHVPSTGGAILVSNHLAVADSFFMPLMMPRRVTFLAKREYFTGKGVKGKLKKYFFSGVGQVPIDRSSGAAAQAALDTGIRLLAEGKLLGVYPEGTRSPDGRLYKGKTGVARMALESGAPVIPIAMFGTDKVNPIGSRMWRPHRVLIKVGPPLDFSRYEGMAGDRSVERAITDEIMYALMELSGQEYVDVYAAKIKDDLAAQGRGVAGWTGSPQRPGGGRMPESKAG
ncbi:1-acyl-sn-glycerol-3-phosphate acyltransferase [Saccharopolyspora subtropica]|uniref:1-acyl-sn-glycerol-3-phosphate acyltransferase n=1 Tax=Saccharopolyspora thermophila TaxID=89367 RepID=A0A917K1M8_9PSEU|nr:lysophospholipid acyltransferase family protein [Saccharopolyspora subtropica]GGI97575.1 1-acyl-sn-glycerol-3-phosphate acyltransferase [Saccharopolyspora subtropica]